MRIRKRFPSVSLSSDPLPLVQQSATDSLPLDLPIQPHSNRTVIGIEKPRFVHPKELDGDEVKDERWSEEEKNNHIIRKSSNFHEDSSTQISPPSSSDQVVERWIEGEKVIPLKKRIVREEPNAEEKDKKMKGKMKSKTNKKCARPYSNNTDEQEEEGSERSKSKISTISKRGSEIMEGSRCSRVNGRGWRCGQQTLVGYSLCEHHLGKGRLRSMSSVRSRAVANSSRPVAPSRKSEPEPEPESELVILDDDSDGDGVKKRVVMVKARSIRSLLGGQTDGVLKVLGDDHDHNKSRSYI